MSLYDATYIFPQVLNFNSKDRISGTNSAFYSEPQTLGDNRYDTCCVVGASIPKSFYNMPSGYNTFKLIENGFPAGVIITIPIGSYTKNNLQPVLSSLLTTASSSMNGYTYTLSYPSALVADTFKYTITISGGVLPNQPSIQMLSGNTSPFRQLGFDSGTTYPFVNNVLTSVNAINLSFILRAFVKSNMVIDANQDILQEFLAYGSFPMLSVISFQQLNFDMNSRKLNPAVVNSWFFELVDDFDQPIDLNGINWAISIVFYQRSSTHEVFKQELNITNEERLFRIEQQQKRIEEALTSQKEPEVEKKIEEVKTETPVQQTTEAPVPLETIQSTVMPLPSTITTQFLPKSYLGPI